MPKTKHKKQLPPEWEPVNDFFSGFGPEGSEEYLWQLLKLALTSMHDISTPEERSNLICFYEQAKELIKASYTLLQQAKKQQGIKPLKA